MAFEEQIRAKEEKNITHKQKFEAEILPLLKTPDWINWASREKGILQLKDLLELRRLPDWPTEVEQYITYLFSAPACEVIRTAALLLGPHASLNQLE